MAKEKKFLTCASVSFWTREYIRNVDLSKGQHNWLRRTAGLFAEFTKGKGKAHITAGVLSDFVVWLQHRRPEFAPRTIKNHRMGLLTVLRFASDRLEIPEIPTRHVRFVKIPPPDPRAWTHEETARLIEAAASMQGHLPYRVRCARSLYALALIGSAYDTGLRRGNLFTLDHTDVEADGTIRCRHHKTGQPHICRLSPVTADLFRAIVYPFPLKWTASSKEYTQFWRELCKAAEIRYGLTQQVRRTAATSVWEESPALIQRFLGHLTSDMWKHYVDQQRSGKVIAPTPIEMPGITDMLRAKGFKVRNIGPSDGKPSPPEAPKFDEGGGQ